MTAPYSDLASKTEQACAALTAAIAGIAATIYTGQSADTKTPPCVICAAEQSDEEEPPYSGNFWLDVDIIIASMAPTDADGVAQKPANDVLVASVVDKFSSTTLASDLNNLIPDFTCQGIIRKGPRFEIDGDAWRNTFSFRALCCPTSL